MYYLDKPLGFTVTNGNKYQEEKMKEKRRQIITLNFFITYNNIKWDTDVFTHYVLKYVIIYSFIDSLL